MVEKKLYDSNSTMYVLGALLRQPGLLHDGKYILTENDFDGMHRIVFGVIYNLAAEGSQSIKPSDIDIYLKQYVKQYEIYKNNKGLDYVRRIFELVGIDFDIKQFDYYYERIKKFSILRDFHRSGIDIKQFYDPDADFTKIDEENKKLNELGIPDFFARVRERVAKIEDSNIVKDNIKAKNASDGLRNLVADLKAQPEVGFALEGEIMTYAARGARLGKLFLYSSPSGHGKTRFFVGNACKLSLPYIENNEIIIHKDLTPVLFIATEMEPDEIQTLVLSYVTGINEERLLTNKLTEEDDRLIEMGLRIIEQYKDNFKIEKISDPNITTLRSKIIKYILNEKYHHIFYDYIFTSPSLNSEFQKTGLREDVILMMLSNTLKEIAADYNVFVYSGTQVSRNWEKVKFRNENLIAGSKAVADKADFGIIAVRIPDEELEAVGPLLAQEGVAMTPNVVMDVYKNRRGRITIAKIFRYFNYSNCRATDLLITDANFHKWNIGMGKIEYKYEKQDLLDLAVSNSKGDEL